MNKNQKLLIAKYLKQVKSDIPFKNKCSKHMLKNLKLSITDFCQENPDFTFDSLVNTFGTPAEIADTLLEEVPPEKIIHSIKQRKVILCASVVMLVVVSAIFCNIYRIFYNHTSFEVKKEVYIPISSSTNR